MSHNICCVPVAPIRKEADHRSELMSQLLFGEYCIITAIEKNGWVKIVNKYDTYTGWCRADHFQEIDEQQYNNTEEMLAADWVNKIEYKGQSMYIPFGSSVAAMKNEFWKNNAIDFTGNTRNPAEAKQDAQTIKTTAYKYLNTAYLWGGRSVFGTDCSGFAQAVFKTVNIPILRDAAQQATQGQLVSFIQEARCGDLAFFDNEEGNIIHVGILLNEFEIIHSAGKVRIDNIDSQGIINTDTGLRTSKLRIIKRYF